MKLKPEDIAGQIEVGGRQVRQADHHAWDKAQDRLEVVARSIEQVVASALEFRIQRYWIAGSGAAALFIGIMLGIGLPGWIDQAVPESWHWPEARAAEMLGRDQWGAGIRLLQVADPQAWQAVARTLPIVRDNARALADCEARVTRTKAAVVCKIKIDGPRQ